MHPSIDYISFVLFLSGAYASRSVYVVPALQSTGLEDGTLEHPFSTVEQARDYLRTKSTGAIGRVALYPTYHFSTGRTLSFDERDCSTLYTSISVEERRQIPQNRKAGLVPLSLPVISGGVQLTDWTVNRTVTTRSLSQPLEGNGSPTFRSGACECLVRCQQ